MGTKSNFHDRFLMKRPRRSKKKQEHRANYRPGEIKENTG
jgi:hypothetical protein